MTKKESPPLPKAHQRMKLVTAKADFDRDIRKLRTKYHLPAEGYSSYQDLRAADERRYEKGAAAELKHLKYLEDLAKLQKRYKLGPYYRKMVDFYFHYNKLESHVIPSRNYTLKIVIDDPVGPVLRLDMYPETTQEDITNDWDEIERFQQKMLGFKPGRFKILKTLDRDLRIVELKRQGKTSNDVAKIVNKEFPSPDKKLLSYSDIDSINSDLKKRISES
jgi:predicted acetyltransferase